MRCCKSCSSRQHNRARLPARQRQQDREPVSGPAVAQAQMAAININAAGIRAEGRRPKTFTIAELRYGRSGG